MPDQWTHALSSTAKRSVRGLFHAIGLEVYRRQSHESQVALLAGEVNRVMPDVSRYPGLQRLIASRIPHPILLLGAANDLRTYRVFLDASEMEWNWDAEVILPEGQELVICSVPSTDAHWRAIQQLKRRYGPHVTSIPELVLPFTPLLCGQATLRYHLQTIDEIAPYYLGEQWFGPIDRLNALYPLSGRRVIEFGPFDGAQTSGLVHHGILELVCIEARAENFIKTLIAKEVFGWNNVRLVMDDMHNADAVKFGRFDLAFCHGTYYHSISPFVLLENLVSLSDRVFIGGYVLKEGSPFETLTYAGESYRVQRYNEVEWFTAGVNSTSYYFHANDLTRFFATRGYGITVMDDEPDDWGTNRYYRFLASR